MVYGRNGFWCPVGGCGKSVLATFDRVNNKVVYRCRVCGEVWVGRESLLDCLRGEGFL